MKTSRYSLFMVVFTICLPYAGIAVDISATLPTAAGDRDYLIHAPGAFVTRNLPVVFVLHGDGGTGASIKSYSGFDNLADTGQFMAVYPSAQNGAWSRAKGELKDVEFISALIDYLCRVYKVNTARVYVTGHSAGAYMAYNLGMSLPDRIAAIAPVAGNMYGVSGYNWNNFFSSPAFRPLPVLHIHGDADGTVAYPDPDHAPTAWNEWPLSSLAYYTCGQTTYTLPQQDLTPSGSVKKLSFCTGSAEISLVRIVGGGHGWPNVSGWNPTAAIWNFFSNYSLSGTSPCDTRELQAVGNQVTDPCGFPFVPRGVNYSLLDDWDFPANLATTERSAEIIRAGPNLVRIQWYADYGQPARPAYNLSHLDQVITRFRNEGVVSMIGLWDLTCSNDYSRFNSVITPWWQQNEVLALIEKHKSFLMINPANEFGNVNWAGTPASALAVWVAHYKNVITTLRSAGIRVPIVIDAPDCGTSLQPLLDSGNELQNHDPLHNLVFSVHGYWAQNFYTDTQLSAFMQSISNAAVPVILGEVANYQSDAQPCQYPINLDHLLTEAQNRNVGWLAWTWFKDHCSDRQLSPSGLYSGLSVYGNQVVNNNTYGLASRATKMHTECLNDALPVTLNRFELSPADDRRSVQVTWETGLTHNFSHFELERSQGNARNFKQVASVTGQSIPDGGQHSYAWVDSSVGAGKYFYRLKMVDTDGTASFSPIKSLVVPGGGKADFEVRPVPADGAFFLSAAYEKFPAEISVSDTRGVVLFTILVNTAEEPVSTASLQPGIYFVGMKGSGHTQRILVVR